MPSIVVENAPRFEQVLARAAELRLIAKTMIAEAREMRRQTAEIADKLRNAERVWRAHLATGETEEPALEIPDQPTGKET